MGNVCLCLNYIWIKEYMCNIPKRNGPCFQWSNWKIYGKLPRWLDNSFKTKINTYQASHTSILKVYNIWNIFESQKVFVFYNRRKTLMSYCEERSNTHWYREIQCNKWPKPSYIKKMNTIFFWKNKLFTKVCARLSYNFQNNK